MLAPHKKRSEKRTCKEGQRGKKCSMGVFKKKERRVLVPFH
jgi:hypothetical protein